MRGAIFTIAVFLAALMPARAQTLKLSDALTRLRWDAEKRGPLLLLDTSKPIAGTLEDQWTSEQLAAALGLQPSGVGGVTCWISPTMRTYPETRTPPDINAAMPYDRLRAQLFNSLKEEQKRLLLSEQGLGLSDLNQTQQRLFLRSLPTQLETLSYSGPIPSGEKTWPEDTHQSIRMRVVRNPWAKLITTHQELKDAPERLFRLEMPRHELSYMHTEKLPDGSTRSHRVSTSEPQGTLLGAVHFREGTNRLKPSDLNYLAPELRAEVPLTPTTTVGELVARVARQSSVELHCDPWLGAYVVHCRGASAPGGSVLQALARMLTATFRRIEGQTWILASEQEPLAVRVARKQEWMKPARKLAEELTRKGSPVWDLTDIPQVGPLAGLKAGRQPLSALPAELRQQAEAQRARYGGQLASRVGDITLTPDSFEADFVTVTDAPEGQLVFPDGTVARDTRTLNAVQGLQNREHTSYPETVMLESRPILFLRASTPEEARERVRLAARQNFNTLWLELPLKADTDNELSLLRAAIQEGAVQQEPVAIGAVVHLLAAPPDPDAMDRDERLIGGRAMPLPYPLLQDQPFEWLAPDAPSVAARVKARVEKIAGLEGLTGLCLLSAAAPGYGEGLITLPSEGFGGRPSNRLAFVRQFHIDPQDIDRGTVSGPVLDTNSLSGVSLIVPGSLGPRTTISGDGFSASGPGLNELRGYQKSWEKALFSHTEALLNPLYESLQTSAPTLRRWIVSSVSPYSSGSWRSVEPAIPPTKGVKPAASASMGYVLCYPGRYSATSAWTIPTPDGPLALARATFECEQDKKHSRYVLDLRQVPIADVPNWLQGVSSL